MMYLYIYYVQYYDDTDDVKKDIFSSEPTQENIRRFEETRVNGKVNKVQVIKVYEVGKKLYEVMQTAI